MADSSSPAQNTRSRASPRPPISRARKNKKDKEHDKEESKTTFHNSIDHSSEEEDSVGDKKSFNSSASSGDMLDGSIYSFVTESSFVSTTDQYGSPKQRAVQSPTKVSPSPADKKKTPVKKTTQSTLKLKHEAKIETGGNQTCTYMSRFLVGFVVVLIAIWLFRSSGSDAESPVIELDRRLELFSSFKQNISSLEKVFSQQNKNLWQTVKGSMRSIIIEEEPNGPAVLLFVIPKDQQNGIKTSQCIGQRIVKTVNNLFHRRSHDHLSVISIRDDLGHKGPAEDKAELDNELIKCFKGQSKGVVIQHLEELAPLATLLLHGYCDGDNAPHKDVVFVLLLNVDKTMSEVTSVKHFADKYLTHLWSSELDLDRSQPLLSRIANNVVVITSENNAVLNAEC